jgi:glycosidase
MTKTLNFLMTGSFVFGLVTLTPVSGNANPKIIRNGHNSFDSFYRSPFGAIAAGSEPLTLRYTSMRDTISNVRLRVFDRAHQQEQWLPMQKVTDSSKADSHQIDRWEARLAMPKSPTVLTYFFEVTEKKHIKYALAHDSLFMTGGWSELANTLDNSRAFKISVYDPSDHVPNWLKGAVIYQIFPDRFRNGNTANDPIDGSGWIYGKSAIKRKWTDPICATAKPGCDGEASQIFYGGDLKGVLEKLNEIQKLGATVIYLNPIFLAPSNHKYDTQDYLQIDPALGTRDEFIQLTSEARKLGIHIILDGVFNHTSSDSPLFDLYHRWQGTGACTSSTSQYRSWYFMPAVSSAAKDPSGQAIVCAGTQRQDVSYEAWYGYPSLPKLNAKDSGVRDLLFAKGNLSVGPNWIQAGASGWRLDVGGDVDPSQIIDPTNGFWRDFKTAIRAIDSEAVLIGEQWGDGRNWLLGHEWDSVMNYRFRSSVLSWMFDRCSGHGCEGGGVFRDNNDNDKSTSGSIRGLSVSQFNLRLQAIQEDYPPEKWLAMMNLLDSHDTSRILFLLKKISGDSTEIARKKLRFLALFQFTYPGAPSIYYGNEVGLAPDDVWDGKTWQDDPYNRAPYPWADQGGHPDTDLRADFAKLAAIHKQLPELQRGEYAPWLTDDKMQIMAFGRSLNGHPVWAVLNRSAEDQTLKLKSPESTPDGTRFRDVLTGEIFTVKENSIQLGLVPALWGRILVSQ